MSHEQFEIFSNQAVAACAVVYFLAFVAQVAAYVNLFEKKLEWEIGQ